MREGGVERRFSKRIRLAHHPIKTRDREASDPSQQRKIEYRIEILRNNPSLIESL